jgi:hypothetical protein
MKMKTCDLKRRIHLTLAVIAGISLPIVSADADILTRTDGTLLTGRFLGYESGVFRFQIGQAVYPLSATEVATLAVEESPTDALSQSVDQIAQNLAFVMQQLEQVEARLDALSSQQQIQAQTTHQRLFELNPLSRLRVDGDSGVFERNGSFRVTGDLRNMSAATVRYPSVRIDLLDANGQVAASQTVLVSSQAVGPGGYSSFRYIFDAPPAFTQYRITPVMEYTTPPAEEGRIPYPPIQMENR